MRYGSPCRIHGQVDLWTMQAALEKFVGEPVISAVSSRTVSYTSASMMESCLYF